MKNRHINALGLFDGMSCMQIALKELGYPVDTYYASEIDKHAIAQTQYNFPDTIQLGDVTKWRDWDIDWSTIDLIGAGSPCQGFSFAGKQLAFNDPRSVLFFVFVDILNHIRTVNPNVKFLLENVRMKAEHEAVITQYTGVNPLYINSALVSAQNRERLYWTNIGMVQRGLFGEWYPGIPQPEDRGILLRDILESEVDEKYYLNDKALSRIDRKIGFIPQINPDKTDTLNTCNNSSRLSFDHGTTLVKIDINGNPKPNQQKASCFTAGAHSGGNHSDMDLICVGNIYPSGGENGNIYSTNGKSPTIKSGETSNSKNGGVGSCNAPKVIDNYIVAQRGRGENNEQQLEPNLSGKTNCLTSVQKDNLVMQLNQSTESNGCQPYQQNRVYDIDGISPALMAQMSCGTHAILEQGMKIRRLTPLECSRLQTIPDWYKWNCSDTQIYRMLGNGWTVEVIKHILKYL